MNATLASRTRVLVPYNKVTPKKCTISWLGTRVLVQYAKVTPEKVYNFLAGNTCACAV